MYKIFGELTEQIDEPDLTDEQREKESETKLNELRALSIVADDWPPPWKSFVATAAAEVNEDWKLNITSDFWSLEPSKPLLVSVLSWSIIIFCHSSLNPERLYLY